VGDSIVSLEKNSYICDIMTSQFYPFWSRSMKKMCAVFLLQLLLPSLCHAQSPMGSALMKNDSLNKIFSDYFEWKLRSYPEWASTEGFEGFSHLVEDYSMEAVVAKEAKCKEFLDRSSQVKPESANYEVYQNIFQAEL